MAMFAYQRVIQNLSIFGYLDLFKYTEWIGTWVQYTWFTACTLPNRAQISPTNRVFKTGHPFWDLRGGNAGEDGHPTWVVFKNRKDSASKCWKQMIMPPEPDLCERVLDGESMFETMAKPCEKNIRNHTMVQFRHKSLGGKSWKTLLFCTVFIWLLKDSPKKSRRFYICSLPIAAPRRGYMCLPCLACGLTLKTLCFLEDSMFTSCQIGLQNWGSVEKGVNNLHLNILNCKSFLVAELWPHIYIYI